MNLSLGVAGVDPIKTGTQGTGRRNDHFDPLPDSPARQEKIMLSRRQAQAALRAVARVEKNSTAIYNRRSVHKHREIEVQLTEDIPGLGKFGSVQRVLPGRMRNELYPRGKAVYIVKGVGPQILARPDTVQLPAVDFVDLNARLSTLPPLVFSRKTIPSASDSEVHQLFGSVSLGEVAQLISSQHNISLVPPDAVLSLPTFKLGNITGNKLKYLGEFTVHATLKTGDVVPLTVVIQAESGSESAPMPENTTQ